MEQTKWNNGKKWNFFMLYIFYKMEIFELENFKNRNLKNITGYTPKQNGDDRGKSY